MRNKDKTKRVLGRGLSELISASALAVVSEPVDRSRRPVQSTQAALASIEPALATISAPSAFESGFASVGADRGAPVQIVGRLATLASAGSALVVSDLEPSGQP